MQTTKWQFKVVWGLIRGYHVDELCRGNFTLVSVLMSLLIKALSCPIHFSFARTWTWTTTGLPCVLMFIERYFGPIFPGWKNSWFPEVGIFSLHLSCFVALHERRLCPLWCFYLNPHFKSGPDNEKHLGNLQVTLTHHVRKRCIILGLFPILIFSLQTSWMIVWIIETDY